jgi:hypothetical protein
VRASDPDHAVTVTIDTPRVRIGADNLHFSLRSSMMLAGTDRSMFWLLFLAIVSHAPRDFSAAGLTQRPPFAEFASSALARAAPADSANIPIELNGSRRPSRLLTAILLSCCKSVSTK